MKHHVELVLKVLQFIMNSCDHKNTGGQMFPLEVFLYAQIFLMATWKKAWCQACSSEVLVVHMTVGIMP